MDILLPLNTVVVSLHVHTVHTAGVRTSPTTTGDKPHPYFDTTYTKVDERRAVFFGGYNEEQRSNVVYIIDLEKMVQYRRECFPPRLFWRASHE